MTGELQRQAVFAPTPDEAMHALEQPSNGRKRSLCGLRVDADDSFVITVTDLNSELLQTLNADPNHTLTIRGLRVCRSCLEKLAS